MSAVIDLDPRAQVADFDAMLEMQEDIDPAVLVVEGVGAGTGVVVKHTPRHSAATLQRCKTVNTYIDKLQSDIRMLTNVRESLSEVTVQLEKEKVDTMIAERISKEAIHCCEALMDNGTFGYLLQKAINENPGPSTRAQTQMHSGMLSAVSSAAEEDMKLFGHLGQENGNQTQMNDSLLEDSVINGLNEPDLPIVESEEEEEEEIDLTLDLDITL